MKVNQNGMLCINFKPIEIDWFKNGGDKLPLPICYPYLACGQLPIPILSAFKIYIGSAGSIPARQIDRNVNKLRVLHRILKVFTAGSSGGFFDNSDDHSSLALAGI
ncbi:hypothetical protein [Limosilactobacillus fermentum]|uniref:hypothetical protein n=1 Tax=Limosilactobacillus fermentum TaxID=1613 RepID=UPI0021A8BFE0|nr:hypothetical protein [Limosilactobacillus fermentum]